jgi:hypothetical protein
MVKILINNMKTVILIFAVLIVSCGRSSKSKELKGDTTYTTINYAYNWANHDYRTVTSIRIKSKDTVKYLVPILDTVRSKIPRIDTIKLKGLTVVDSLGNVAVRRFYAPELDSAGKVKLEMRWPELPKQYLIVDYGKNWKK